MTVSAGDADRRPVRSFVRRAGRLTPSQARALQALWPRYGIEPATLPIDLHALFGRDVPISVEIGFGNGDNLATLAARHAGRSYLGVEVHEPGIGHLLLRLERERLTNVRIARHDAVEVLQRWLPEASLDEVLVFFPDPWPKKRHHKRRLVQPPFLATLARVTAPGARLYLATDWADYAHQMLATCDAAPWFDNLAGGGAWSERPESRPPTKFERRGLRLGHAVFDLAFRRNDTRASAPG